jgi:RES domain-containing protein
MRFWRICRRRYAAEAAPGEGARLYGSRWNSRGLRVVYASTSLALAAVETFVNLEPNLQPKDLVSIEGEVPDELEIGRLDPGSLPSNWHETRNETLRRFGDEWIRAGRTVALVVPSAAIRGEWNVLLNPVHIHFHRIKFGAVGLGLMRGCSASGEAAAWAIQLVRERGALHPSAAGSDP